MLCWPDHLHRVSWVVRQKHIIQCINCIYFGHKTTVDARWQTAQRWSRDLTYDLHSSSFSTPLPRPFPFRLLFSFVTVKSRARLTCIRSQLLSLRLKIPQSLKSFFSSAKFDTWANTSFSLKIPHALIPLLARLAHQLSSWNCSDITLLPFSLLVYIQRKCLSHQVCHQSNAESIGKNWASIVPTWPHFELKPACNSLLVS